MMTLTEIDTLIREEITRADEKYGDFTSSHEGLGVLLEEVQELVEAIRANYVYAIQKESAQVAAVATRIAYAMTNPHTQKRSGC